MCSKELRIGRGIVLSSCKSLDIAYFWQEYWNKAGRLAHSVFSVLIVGNYRVAVGVFIQFSCSVS